jgi:hypothetical protein
VELQQTAAGAEPELVLVLEVAGSVDEFVRAVRNVRELEWLGALFVEELDPEPDFIPVDTPDARIPGRLFLVMSNQQALGQLLGLWNRFAAGERFDRGFTPFRDVFARLVRIRRWGPLDRLAETGVLQDWEEHLRLGQQPVRFEAELWFRRTAQLRETALARFERSVRAAGGQLVGSSVAEEIRYHGVLAEVPRRAIAAVLQQDFDADWVQADEIMFFDAAGQFLGSPVDRLETAQIGERVQPAPSGTPVIAMFDGLPLQNHRMLDGRLIVDDPDGWSATYPAVTREHGTAMASVIVHGDLSAVAPALTRPIYVRPIMKPPTAPDWVNRPGEEIPADELVVDLMKRAVARLFEPGPTGAPVAPTVRLINLSVGERFRLFDRALSPWARIVDWLAFRYGVLFVISAGNHLGDIRLSLRAPWAGHTAQAIRRDFLRKLHADLRNRRLRAPAEAINALTVGAVHFDSGALDPNDTRVDPLKLSMAAGYNSLGTGFRRAIKPDVFVAGGRLLYERPIGGGDLVLRASGLTSRSPGLAAAAPSPAGGGLDAVRYIHGTSVAAAVATRAGGRLHVVLEQLRATYGADGFDPDLDAVLLKALIAHTASWQHRTEYVTAFAGLVDGRAMSEYLSRYVGYGTLNSQRLLGAGEATRATALRAGRITNGAGHIYRLPLPGLLSGRADRRRLTITLAWLSPLSPAHHSYRAAALWFEVDGRGLGVERDQADWRAARRGTLQHEVLLGDRAVPFGADASLEVKVNCREDAPTLDVPVPYALAVTLEVAPPTPVQVHAQIAARLQVPIRV